MSENENLDSTRAPIKFLLVNKTVGKEGKRKSWGEKKNLYPERIVKHWDL